MIDCLNLPGIITQVEEKLICQWSDVFNTEHSKLQVNCEVLGRFSSEQKWLPSREHHTLISFKINLWIDSCQLLAVSCTTCFLEPFKVLNFKISSTSLVYVHYMFWPILIIFKECVLLCVYHCIYGFRYTCQTQHTIEASYFYWLLCSTGIPSHLQVSLKLLIKLLCFCPLSSIFGACPC
jgi:hypothetical protein